MKSLCSFSALLALHVPLSGSAGLVGESPFRLLHPVINTPSNTIAGRSGFNITAEFDGYDKQVAFVLEPNRDLFTQKTRTRYLDSGQSIEDADPISEQWYHVTKGVVWTKVSGQPWDNVGWARLMVTREGPFPLFEGIFTMLDEVFEIQTQRQNSDSSSTAKDEELKVYPASATHPTDSAGIPGQELALNRTGCMTTPSSVFHKRQSLSNETASVFGSSSDCFDTKRVAYIGIAIDCSYRNLFESDTDVKRNIINVVNTASVVFENSFNIALALQDMVISESECLNSTPATHRWDTPCSTGDLSWRLNQFGNWRTTVQDDNAFWTLMTGCLPSAGEIGVSWVGQVCKTENSIFGSGTGANVVCHSKTEWQVFAHESAHMFGANHDCNSDNCSSTQGPSGDCCTLSSSVCDAKEEYLMNPITHRGMTGFSACTVRSICSRIDQAAVDTQCLVTPKEVEELKDQVSLPDGKCGNGIVETGEACDCGVGSCDESEARCCDPSTCQWQDEGSCSLSQYKRANSSWIAIHKSLFIGLVAGLGSLVVLLVTLIIFASVLRKRRKQKLKTTALQ